MQKALITGATSGIGYELAKIMAAKGHDLVLVSRNMDKLRTVQKEIETAYSVSVSVEASDLSVPGTAEKIYAKFKDHNIEILVNNAGAGLKGNFFDDELKDNQTIAYLNMNSLMEMTYYFGKDMVAVNSGKVLNVASIVAFLPGPKQPGYYASKAFVRSFSRALAYNMRNSNVSVTALHPGVTKTNFFNAAHAKNFNGGASAQSVAQLGYDAMMAGKIEVTHGLRNKILTNVFTRLTPYRLQPLVVDKVSDV